VLAAAGRPADARTALARALEADPTRAEARYELGFLAAATGDHGAARRETEHAMAHAPLVTRRPLALALDLGGAAPRTLASAEARLRAGLYERASAAVSAALARGADRAAGLVLLADAFAAQGYYGEALERYEEARQLAPMSTRARLGELRMLRETGRRTRALAAADALVEAHPAHAEALALLALARADEGDAEAAR